MLSWRFQLGSRDFTQNKTIQPEALRTVRTAPNVAENSAAKMAGRAFALLSAAENYRWNVRYPASTAANFAWKTSCCLTMPGK